MRRVTCLVGNMAGALAFRSFLDQHVRRLAEVQTESRYAKFMPCLHMARSETKVNVKKRLTKEQEIIAFRPICILFTRPSADISCQVHRAVPLRGKRQVHGVSASSLRLDIGSVS